jgi:effector-binding domain-containing protein
MGYEIEVRRLQPQHTAVVRTRCPWDKIAETLGGIFGEVMARIGATGAQATGGVFGRYDPGMSDVGIEAGFTVAAPITPAGRVEASELPGGDAAVTLHVGDYGSVAAAYEAIEAWMREQGREAAGPAWELYLTPPEEQPQRTEVFFPLRPKNA